MTDEEINEQHEPLYDHNGKSDSKSLAKEIRAFCASIDAPQARKNTEKEKVDKCEDVVNHPSHYITGKFECIDVMIETQGIFAVKQFCVCNAFKYLYRHKNKNGAEDIKKAAWYLNKYIELSKGAQ